MKKIVVAGPVGSPGGLQTHNAELRRFLAAEGHDVFSVDVPLADSDLNELRSHSSERAFVVNGAASSGAVKAKNWFAAMGAVRRFRPHILISVSNGYGYAMLGLAAPRGCFTVRTEVTDNWRNRDPLHEIMARIYSATAVQSPRLLIAQREKISANHRMAILPCFAGIQPNGALSSAPDRSQPLKLAFFGRLAANKGLIELVEAIASGAIPENASVDLWGAGPMASRIEPLISQRSLENVVRLRGRFPSGPEFSQLLASYHGLLLPSQYSEGLPLILLEAASVGLPFLTCDVGAISDCTLDNPDATVIPIGAEALQGGLRHWCSRLEAGDFNPGRLQAWYERYHSREVHENLWRQMLNEPADYFRRA